MQFFFNKSSSSLLLLLQLASLLLIITVIDIKNVVSAQQEIVGTTSITIAPDAQTTQVAGGEAQTLTTLIVNGTLAGSGASLIINGDSRTYQRVKIAPAVCPGTRITVTGYETAVLDFDLQCPELPEVTCGADALETNSPIVIVLSDTVVNASKLPLFPFREINTAVDFKFLPDDTLQAGCFNYRFKITVRDNVISGTKSAFSLQLKANTNISLADDFIFQRNVIFRQRCALGRDVIDYLSLQSDDPTLILSSSTMGSNSNNINIDVTGLRHYQHPLTMATASRVFFSSNEIQDECPTYKMNEKIIPMVYMNFDFSSREERLSNSDRTTPEGDSGEFAFRQNEFHKFDFGDEKRVKDGDSGTIAQLTQPSFVGLVNLSISSSGSTTTSSSSTSEKYYTFDSYLNDRIASHASSSAMTLNRSPVVRIIGNKFFPKGGVASSNEHSSLSLADRTSRIPAMMYDRRFWDEFNNEINSLVQDSTLWFYVIQVSIVGSDIKNNNNNNNGVATTSFNRIDINSNIIEDFSVLSPNIIDLSGITTNQFSKTSFCNLYSRVYDNTNLGRFSHEVPKRIHLSLISVVITAMTNRLRLTDNTARNLISQSPTNTFIQVLNLAEVFNAEVLDNKLIDAKLLRRENCDIIPAIYFGDVRPFVVVDYVSSAIYIVGGQFSTLSILGTESSFHAGTYSSVDHIFVGVTQIADLLEIKNSRLKTHRDMFGQFTYGIVIESVNCRVTAEIPELQPSVRSITPPSWLLMKSPSYQVGAIGRFTEYWNSSSRIDASSSNSNSDDSSSNSNNNNQQSSTDNFLPRFFSTISVSDTYFEYSHDIVPEREVGGILIQQSSGDPITINKMDFNFTEKTDLLHKFAYVRVLQNVSSTQYLRVDNCKTVFSKFQTITFDPSMNSWSADRRVRDLATTRTNTDYDPTLFSNPQFLYEIPGNHEIAGVIAQHLKDDLGRFFISNVSLAVRGIFFQMLSNETRNDPYTMTYEKYAMVRWNPEQTQDPRFGDVELVHIYGTIPIYDDTKDSIIQVTNSILVTAQCERSKLLRFGFGYEQIFSMVNHIAVVDCLHLATAHPMFTLQQGTNADVVRQITDLFLPDDTRSGPTSPFRRLRGPEGGINVTIVRTSLIVEDNASVNIVATTLRGPSTDNPLELLSSKSSHGRLLLDRVDFITFTRKETHLQTDSSRPFYQIDKFNVISNEFPAYPTGGLVDLNVKAIWGTIRCVFGSLLLYRVNAANVYFMMGLHAVSADRAVFNDPRISTLHPFGADAEYLATDDIDSGASSSSSPSSPPICSTNNKHLISPKLSLDSVKFLFATTTARAPRPASADSILAVVFPASPSTFKKLPPTNFPRLDYSEKFFADDNTSTKNTYLFYCGNTLSVSQSLSSNVSTRSLTESQSVQTFTLTNTSFFLKEVFEQPENFETAKQLTKDLGLAMAAGNPVGAAKAITVLNLVDGIYYKKCGGPVLHEQPDPAASPISISLGAGGFQAGLVLGNLIVVIGCFSVFLIVYYGIWLVRHRYFPRDVDVAAGLVDADSKRGIRRRLGRSRREFREMIHRRRQKIPSIYVAAARSRSTSVVEFAYTLLTYPVLVAMLVVPARDAVPFSIKFVTIIVGCIFFGIAIAAYYIILFRRTRIEHYRYYLGVRSNQVSTDLVDPGLKEEIEEDGYSKFEDDDYTSSDDSSSDDDDSDNDSKKKKRKKREAEEKKKQKRKELEEQRKKEQERRDERRSRRRREEDGEEVLLGNNKDGKNNNNKNNSTEGDSAEQNNDETHSDNDDETKSKKSSTVWKKITGFLENALEFFAGAEGEYFVPSRRKVHYTITRSDKEQFKLAEPILEGYTDRFPRFSIWECLVQAGAAVGIFLAEVIADEVTGCWVAAVLTLIVLFTYLGAVLYYRPHQERILKWTVPPSVFLEAGSIVIALVGGDFSDIGSMFIAIVSLQMVTTLFSLAGWVTSILWPFMKKILRKYLRGRSRVRAKNLRRAGIFVDANGNTVQQEDEAALNEFFDNTRNHRQRNPQNNNYFNNNNDDELLIPLHTMSKKKGKRWEVGNGNNNNNNNFTTADIITTTNKSSDPTSMMHLLDGIDGSASSPKRHSNNNNNISSSGIKQQQRRPDGLTNRAAAILNNPRYQSLSLLEKRDRYNQHQRNQQQPSRMTMNNNNTISSRSQSLYATTPNSKQSPRSRSLVEKQDDRNDYYRGGRDRIRSNNNNRIISSPSPSSSRRRPEYSSRNSYDDDDDDKNKNYQQRTVSSSSNYRRNDDENNNRSRSRRFDDSNNNNNISKDNRGRNDNTKRTGTRDEVDEYFSPRNNNDKEVRSLSSTPKKENSGRRPQGRRGGGGGGGGGGEGENSYRTSVNLYSDQEASTPTRSGRRRN